MKMLLGMVTLTLTFMMNCIIIFSNKFKMNFDKMLCFECGFNSFEAARNPFSMLFFKILLIFLLFDMEIIVVLPLPLFMYKNIMNMTIIYMIMIILLAGLFFEWKENSLEWLK